MPRDRKWHFWTNGVDEMSVFEDDLPPDGWWQGRKPVSQETRDKSSASAVARGSNNKGKKLSDQARKNMSVSKQKFLKDNPDWKSPSQWEKGHIPWNKNVPMRQETKDKLSISRQGTHLSDESRKLKNQHEYETKKKNNSFHTSKPEGTLLNVLYGWFGEENVEHPYHDDRYPFNCDYYIKSLDLFIELNYHWTHGGHPFNPNDQADIDKVNTWKSKNTKFYDEAINVWTVRDVNKLKYAKENKLNYIAIYNKEELHDFIREMKKRFSK